MTDGHRHDRPLQAAIVVVCYNQAHFLADALGSAVDQSLPATEVVLVDDGSDDDTEAVTRRFPTVRYIRQDNAGLPAARNAGLNAVGSGAVLFLDADDRLDRDALAMALPALAATPSLAFVFGGYREVDEHLAPLSLHPPASGDASLAGLLRGGNHIAMHGTVLYDTAKLRAAGGFDEGLTSCEDYDVYLRLARGHGCAAYPHIAADYRRHGRSMSRHRLRMIDTALRVLARHSRSREERRLARHGRAIMLNYYGPALVADLHQAVRERRRDVVVALLRGIAARPALWPFAVRRIGRAAITPLRWMAAHRPFRGPATR